LPSASFARGGGSAGMGQSRATAAAVSTAFMAADPALGPNRNAIKVAPLPPPRINVPAIPQFK
jgi:hypothetical protein